MPPPPSPHGTANRWRTGCRCDDCADAHLDDLADWRARRAKRLFPAATRQKLLVELAKGVPLGTAAARLEIAVQRIHAFAWTFPRWGERLDAALMAGRDPQVRHGTATGYRHGRCRCPECREWRSNQDRPGA